MEDNEKLGTEEFIDSLYKGLYQALLDAADHPDVKEFDAKLLNTHFIAALSNIVGDMVGHFSEEEQTDILQNVFRTIEEAAALTSSDIAFEKNLLEKLGLPENVEDDINRLVADMMGNTINPVDLKDVKPRGSC